jgi:galactonate dehydratase
VPPKRTIVDQPLTVDAGYLLVPERPGIGIELAPDARQRHPYQPRAVVTRLKTDGSVMDQ